MHHKQILIYQPFQKGVDTSDSNLHKRYVPYVGDKALTSPQLILDPLTSDPSTIFDANVESNPS